MKTKILIVDDEKMTRDAMCRALSRTYECLSAPDAEAALATLEAHPDLALLLTDYKMPGMNGQELIVRAKAMRPELGAIIITAFGEVELAVEAMKHGANDFIPKPITDLTALESRIAMAIKTVEPEPAKAGQSPFDGELAEFTGKSPAMEKVYRLIRKVAPTDSTVMIEGASGSGKELAARAVHQLSRRAKGPFIAVECSAFSEDLLKSELFGYDPGSFTGGLKEGKKGCFEEASGGTLFLDEIGEIDLGTQVALLRTIETKSVRRIGSARETPVDFRLVTATNRNLAEMVAEGKFREDLYYRLNVIGIRMPALKDHPEDIAPLVSRFLREYADRNGSRVTDIEPAALRALEQYRWPGNVRQLRNVIEKMVVLSSGEKLTSGDLPPEITDLPPPAASPAAASPAVADTLADTERTQILATLANCGNNKTRAAELLGISRRTLHRKLKEWKCL